MTSLPSTMRAVQLKAHDGKPESITIAEIPIPTPGPGQVLVKVHASPVNPSDLLFIRGLYAFKKTLPTVPGFEGSGTVVEAGSGMMPRLLKGRRVACSAADANIGGGMWAEYVATPAQFCVPLSKGVDVERAATMLINPLTAWALMDETRRGRHRAVVQTAAASALGRMVVRLGKRFSIPVICVVRRVEQGEILRRIGAEYVLNSGDTRFAANLRDMCQELTASIGFDAVAGELTATVLRAQPRGSRLLVYGGLSLAASQVDPASLIFENKHLEGFYLTDWLSRKTILARIRLARQVQELLGTDLKTEIQARLPLEDVVRALERYAAHMTAGKILLMP